MKILVLFLFIIFLLGGCASNTVEPRNDLCKFSSVTELSGKYVNLGVGKLENRNVYLSEVIWFLSKKEADFKHSNVAELIIISKEDNIAAIATTPDSKQHRVQFDQIVEFENGIVNLYHDMGILPDPSGGLVVGPQVVDLNLNKDCPGNLILHKFESADGLLLLFIPVSSELNRYVTFYRVIES